MATGSTRKGMPLEVQATIVDRPAELKTVMAYAFSSGGALLDAQPLDKEGRARLTVPVGKEPADVRVVLGPEIEKDALDVGEALRRGGAERHVALRPTAEVIPPIRFEVNPDVWRCWIGRLCVVKGTLMKRVVSGGVTLHLPVCRAVVDVFEVDPWPRIIVELPDLDIDRLREIVDGPWPPIHLPPPPPPPPILPEFTFGSAPRPFSLPGSLASLNPQPLPPRGSRVAQIRGFDPQPDPPVLAVAQQAMAAPLPAALVLAARGPRVAFERAVLDHVDLLRPILCWLYPLRVRKTKIATLTTDDCGHFRGVIWRSCNNSDKPDLYFTARQRLFPSFWITIYEPTPVGCHTHWNYACGTEVSLVTSHPFARACPPCPPVVAPNNWVLFMAIGNTSVWRIHGANTTTRVGAPGHVAAKAGLVDDTAPWGGTLRPRLEFDSSLRADLGVKYYRVSYKRPTEADTEWRHGTEAVNRHYTREVAGDLILEQFPLGPTTVGTSPHLYEIPPALPPEGQWSIPNVVLDTQNAVIPTVAVAPGLGFDSSFNPVGTDQGGLWQIRVELFDAAGSQVDPEGLGITWRVPESTDLSGTIQTADAATLGLVDAVRNCMIVTVRVDNNPCAALIDAPTLDGVPAPAQCGVMDYTSRSQTVRMPFLALQRNAFATYSFAVRRGADSPLEVDLSGTAATSPATSPAAPTSSVDDLLNTCQTAGFAEHLYVAHTATDGWSRQGQYDAQDLRAFVLAKKMTPAP